MPAAVIAVIVIALLAWRLLRQGVALRRALAAEAQLRLVAEHAIEAGWLIDCASSELLYISPLARLQFGCADAGLAARLAGALPQRVAGLLAGDASCRRQVSRFERGPDDDAAAPALEVVSTLVDGADGRPRFLVGALRDSTAHDAQEQAQKRFASMLSHEFRSPLCTIDGAIQRLDMTSAGADEATRKRYRKIQGAVERLLELIDEYLTPERMAAVGRARAPDTLAPRALLETAAAAADSPRHPVTLRMAKLPASLRCDPAGMQLCLQVLLDNADKHTPAGSPIELAGGPAAEGGVEFVVSDSGPGVPEDEIALLFDKGFRGRHARAGGSGLGLYLARSVVDAHGGTLTVRNRTEGGAIFRIWLPFPADAGKILASRDVSADNSFQETKSGRP